MPVNAPATDPRACLPQELIASSAFLLARLGTSIKMQFFEEFEGTGFTPYHFSVLALLDEGTRETQATIADALKVDRTTLVGLLDTLEERQCIERKPDPKDRRRNLVTLTKAGKVQLAQFRKLSRRVEDEILSPLSKEDQAALHRVLLELAAQRDWRYGIGVAQPAA